MRRTLAIGLLIIMTLLVACGGGGGGEESEIGDVRKGKQIFESGGDSGVPCITCHTRDGSELVGPSLQGLKDRAGDRVPGLSAEEYVRQSITDPSSYLVDGYEDTMAQTFSDAFSDEDINNLIAYVLTLE